MTWSTPLRASVALALLLLTGCRSPREEPRRADLPRGRGLVLISIDTLRPDSLGVYGAERPNSPHLDRLAERGVVFENAFAQIPSTLPSHLSMFTGLYPSEHGVLPPSGVLSERIPTLPELLRAAGVRTAGHSEGALVKGRYGFQRGFEEWTDTAYKSDTDVERTFRRGLASLGRVAPDERFFLFLHTYTVHDPYEPPAALRAVYWPGPPPAGAFPPTGRGFRAFNKGRRTTAPGSERYFRALYDAGVAAMDAALGDFLAGLEKLGLTDETTIVFTSDHGEEFLEHGRFVHTQTYPETLRIPLVVVPPRSASPRRVHTLVETVDYLPSILDLFDVPTPAGLLGESFAPLLVAGGERAEGRAFAQGESVPAPVNVVVEAIDGALHELVVARPQAESDGYWVEREIRFDAAPPRLEFGAVAFNRAWPVEVFVDGRSAETFEVTTDWRRFAIALPPGAERRRVHLRAPGCTRLSRKERGHDERCLSFKIHGPELVRVELYDLEGDPYAARDLSQEHRDRVRTLAATLRSYPTVARHAAGTSKLTEEQVRQLRALGYL